MKKYELEELIEKGASIDEHAFDACIEEYERERDSLVRMIGKSGNIVGTTDIDAGSYNQYWYLDWRRKENAWRPYTPQY